MGKGVTFSKKHGLNPSMAVCPICGKAESVALLGHIKGYEEAPRYIQGDICDECKARVADNKCFVILLLVKIYLHKRLKVVLFL